MGALCPAPVDPGQIQKQGLTVYGDYFTPETRSIMIMIQMGGIQHEFQPVDQFKGEHKREDYIKLNPTGSLPTLTEGRFLVLGGYVVFLNYLVNHHRPIKEKLYPPEFKQQIDKILLWFQSIMRVCSQRLIRMIIGPQAFGEKQYSQDDIKETLDEFFTQIIAMLDRKLQRYEYLCGDDYTVADIQLYNEIFTVLTLHKKQLESREYPNVFSWYNKLSSIPEIQESNMKFKEIVNKYNLA